MSKIKYYKGYFHDHEADCVEGVNDDYYIIAPDAKTTTDVYGNETFVDGSVKPRPNVRKGEVLIYRVDRNGKPDKDGITAPYCDFVEHFREQIKAPKGYLKRVKKYAKLVKLHGYYEAMFYE